MKTSLQAFVVLASLAFVQSYESPTNYNGIVVVDETAGDISSSTTKMIDVDFDIDLFSELMRSRKKFEFEFDTLFDFDSTERVLISRSSDAVGKSNSSLYDDGNDDQRSAAPPFIVFRDHVTDKLVDPKILPCRFLTREGAKIQDLNHLKAIFDNSRREPSSTSNLCILQSPDDDSACSNNDSIDEFEELHLYKVPSGRVFIYTTTFNAKCETQNYR